METESGRIDGFGGIVLCGGKSTRMGRPKHLLPFGNEVLLQRMCRILSAVVEPVVVVASVDQELPRLQESIIVARDQYQAAGPLAGIATGLSKLSDSNCELSAAFVTSCDSPLLKVEFIQELISRLKDDDCAIPTDGKHVHVLAGVYRLTLAEHAHALVRAGKRRPLSLVESSQGVLVPIEELQLVDPELHSLRNANTPESFSEVLRLGGME